MRLWTYSIMTFGPPPSKIMAIIQSHEGHVGCFLFVVLCRVCLGPFKTRNGKSTNFLPSRRDRFHLLPLAGREENLSTKSFLYERWILFGFNTGKNFQHTHRSVFLRIGLHGTEEATGLVSTKSGDENWLSTSQLKVTKFYHSGYAVKLLSAHFSVDSNSLSLHLENKNLSVLISVVI